MAELKEIAAKVAHLLTGAFGWADTPQGHNYWAQVYIDLTALAEIQDDGYGPSAIADTWERGPAPFENERERKLALELADLIDELLLYFLAPILDGDEKPFDRWSVVRGNLLDLGGEGPTEEWFTAIEEDR